MTLKAVFFDLDGTFLDTALDLANALNKLLLTHNKETIAPEKLRNIISDGANALLAEGFQITPQSDNYAEFRQRLLDNYLADLAHHTTPFEGITELVEKLAHCNIRWGIATNKPWTYTEPLMRHFSFASEPIATICPDHVKQKKPHPESLLLACQKADCLPEEAVFVGDHLRDIQCGIHAQMPTIAVGYGYITQKNAHLSWGATHTVENAAQIWPVLQENYISQ